MNIKPGDILVQYKGQPWVFLADAFTGSPYPHAMIVSRVENGTVYAWENNWFVRESIVSKIDNYEIWRPKCSDEIKQKAIAWVAAHAGEGYGTLHLIEILIGYRLGLRCRPGMDDDVTQDNRLKVCSETIAMAYYRSGYDVAPGVENVDTMPGDLRNPVTCERMFYRQAVV